MNKRGKRHEAMAAGDQYYETGLPCKNGHTTKRLTVTGACVSCTAANTRKARETFKVVRNGRLSNNIA